VLGFFEEAFMAYLALYSTATPAVTVKNPAYLPQSVFV
jgi:hypothetical protein